MRGVLEVCACPGSWHLQRAWAQALQVCAFRPVQKGCTCATNPSPRSASSSAARRRSRRQVQASAANVAASATLATTLRSTSSSIWGAEQALHDNAWWGGGSRWVRQAAAPSRRRRRRRRRRQGLSRSTTRWQPSHSGQTCDIRAAAGGPQATGSQTSGPGPCRAAVGAGRHDLIDYSVSMQALQAQHHAVRRPHSAAFGRICQQCWSSGPCRAPQHCLHVCRSPDRGHLIASSPGGALSCPQLAIGAPEL